jgi:hypothetical protein
MAPLALDFENWHTLRLNIALSDGQARDNLEGCGLSRGLLLATNVRVGCARTDGYSNVHYVNVGIVKVHGISTG